MSLFSSIGGATYSKTSTKVIRLIRKGCANRPFFHISVMEKIKEPYEPVIEQIGNYDPLPNKYNEKLVGINFERLDYWLIEGVEITQPVLQLLGLSGYFPVHPNSFMEAWDNRKKISMELEELRIKAGDFLNKENLKSEKPTSAASAKSSESSSDSTGTVLASSAESLSEPVESVSPKPSPISTETVLSSSAKSLSDTTKTMSDKFETETVSTDPSESTSTPKKPSSPTTDS